MSFSRCYGQHRLPFGIMTSVCIKAVSLAVEEGTTSFDPSLLQIKHYACDIDGGLMVNLKSFHFLEFHLFVKVAFVFFE